MSRSREPRLRTYMPWVWVGAFALVDGALLFHKQRLAEPVAEAAPMKPSASLDLAVERQGSLLVVRWNPDTVAMQKATHGLLSVTDGDYERRIGLTNRDLRSGSARYAPLSRNVSFHLALYDGVVSGKGSVLFLARTEPDVQAAAPARGTEIRVEPQAERRSREIEKPTEKNSLAGPSPEMPREPELATITKQAETLVTLPPVSPTQEPVRPATVTPVPTATPLPVPKRPPPPQPSYRITVTSEPTRGTRFEQVLSKVPFFKRIAKTPSSSDLVKPVRRVEPDIAGRPEMTEALDASVEIQVDDSGEVKTARLLDMERAPGNFDWAALRAARSWRFEAPKGGQTPWLVLIFHLEPVRNARGE